MAWNKKEELEVPNVDEFFKPSTELPPVEGLKVGVYGLPGSGKSHFALTAPKPIFVIDTEFGSRLVVDNAVPPEERDKVYIFEALQLDPETMEPDPIQSLEEVEKALKAVVKYVQDHSDVRGTIVIDSASDIWQWIGVWLEEEGARRRTKSGEVPRFEWGRANKRYLQMIYKLLRSKWHVVLTGKVQEVFTEDGTPTGRYRSRWQKDTEHWLDIVMKAEVMIPPGKTTPVRQFTIVKCRAWNISGTIVDCTWDKLVKFVEEKAKVKVL